jgi:hypothetical protein
MTPFQLKLAKMLNTRILTALEENDIDTCDMLHSLACEIEFQIAMESSYEVGEQFMAEVRDDTIR